MAFSAHRSTTSSSSSLDAQTKAKLKGKLIGVRGAAMSAKALATGPAVVPPNAPVILGPYQNAIQMQSDAIDKLVALLDELIDKS
ncbi:MAG: hypothetical protein Rubg2KO_17750 [Rubricoccaceae bacterium]